jgi:hypothetical protein
MMVRSGDASFLEIVFLNQSLCGKSKTAVNITARCDAYVQERHKIQIQIKVLGFL